LGKACPNTDGIFIGPAIVNSVAEKGGVVRVCKAGQNNGGRGYGRIPDEFSSSHFRSLIVNRSGHVKITNSMFDFSQFFRPARYLMSIWVFRLAIFNELPFLTYRFASTCREKLPSKSVWVPLVVPFF
jgi:hypothetical protein